MRRGHVTPAGRPIVGQTESGIAVPDKPGEPEPQRTASTSSSIAPFHDWRDCYSDGIRCARCAAPWTKDVDRGPCVVATKARSLRDFGVHVKGGK